MNGTDLNDLLGGTQPVAWIDPENLPIFAHEGGATCHGLTPAKQGKYTQPLYTEPKACEWVDDGIEPYWATECGEAFTFVEGGPYENSMKFCCYCGGRIVTPNVGDNPPPLGGRVD